MKHLYLKVSQVYIKKIQIFNDKSVGKLWFRGQRDAKWSITPSIYRKDYIDDQGVDTEETEVLRYTRQRGFPFIKEKLDAFDEIFLAQHYGFPTRLIDWTESPLLGLFFALDGWSGDGDIAMYVLDPSLWNEQVLYERQKMNYKRILPLTDDFVEKLKPGNASGGHNLPLCIHATRNNDRIVAQRGEFTLFGTSRLSLEEEYKKINSPEGEKAFLCALKKLVIKKNSVENFRKSLDNFGITESSIYPSLDSIAKEIKRIRGFK